MELGTLPPQSYEELYTFAPNHLNPDASFGGCLFDTFGDEIEHVNYVWSKHPKRVWTIIEGERGLYIISGMQYVNRVGYLITNEDVKPEHRNVQFTS